MKPPPRAADEPSQTRRRSTCKVRVPVTAGPHDARRDVPEEAVVAARNRAPAATRPTSTATGIRGSQPAVYSGLDHRPVSTPSGPGDTPSRRRIFVSPARPARRRRSAAPGGSSPTLMRRAYRRPVDRRGPARRRWSSTGRRARRADFDAGIEMALSRRAGEPAVPVPRRARSRRRRRRTRPIASATSSWRRGCRSSCGAAFRTTSCSTLADAGKLQQARRCSSSRCGGCWPIRARARW